MEEGEAAGRGREALARESCKGYPLVNKKRTYNEHWRLKSIAHGGGIENIIVCGLIDLWTD